MRRNNEPIDSFNDFLGLANRSFERERLLVFHGTSGSGKKPNLKFLADHHPQFVSRNAVDLDDGQELRCFRRSRPPTRGSRRDHLPLSIPSLHKLLKANQTVAVASHLHPLWFKILGPTLPIRSFQTDRSAKLRALPASQRSTVLEEALQSFCRRYRASYAELQCILERSPAKPRPCPQLQPEIRQNHDFQKEGLDAHPPLF